MTKYTNQISEVILDRVNIVDLISRYLPLKRGGRNHMGLCPFHNEKTPSFSVSEEKQLYHCFGCQASGNAIGFVMEKEHLDFIDAVEFLADQFGIDLSPYKVESGKPDYSEHKKRLYHVNRQAAIYYYKNLKRSDLALSYLMRRGISAEMIDHFGLGYSGNTWDGLLKAVGSSEGLQSEMLKAGLITEKKEGGGYYDRFRGRIMFPIRDVKGNFLGFGGRVMDETLPKYLNTSETQVFSKSSTLYGLYHGKKDIKDAGIVLVVEGYMDVIALHQQGITYAVATLGTALTAEHGRILDRYANTIVLCFDGDLAGKKAAMRSIDVLKDVSAKVKVLTLENNMDPDEYIRKRGKESFLSALDEAKESFAYQLDVLKLSYNLNQQQGRLDYLKKAALLIRGLASEVEKSYYIDFLSKDMNYDRMAIAKEVSGQTQFVQKNSGGMGNSGYKSFNEQRRIEKVGINTSGRNALNDIEKKLFELALHSRQAFNSVIAKVSLTHIRNEEIRKLFSLIESYYERYAEMDMALFSPLFDLESSQAVGQIYGNMVVSDQFEKDLNATLASYQLYLIDEKIEEVKAQRLVFENNEAVQMTADEANKIKLMFIRKETELKQMKSEANKGKQMTRGGKINE